MLEAITSRLVRRVQSAVWRFWGVPLMLFPAHEESEYPKNYAGIDPKQFQHVFVFLS